MALLAETSSAKTTACLCCHAIKCNIIHFGWALWRNSTCKHTCQQWYITSRENRTIWWFFFWIDIRNWNKRKTQNVRRAHQAHNGHIHLNRNQFRKCVQLLERARTDCISFHIDLQHSHGAHHSEQFFMFHFHNHLELMYGSSRHRFVYAILLCIEHCGCTGVLIRSFTRIYCRIFNMK